MSTKLPLNLALAAGLILSSALTLALTISMNPFRSVIDSLIVSSILTVGCTTIFIILNYFVFVFSPVMGFRKSSLPLTLLSLDVFVTLVIPVTVGYVCISRPFSLFHISSGVGILLVVALCGICAYVTGQLISKRMPDTRRALILIYVLVFFLPGIVVFVQGKLHRTRDEPAGQGERRGGEKIVLVGIDGATWDVISSSRVRERMPNLGKLISEGVRSTLISEVAVNQPFANSASRGMRTPVIWESITTGRSPRDHGIWDFYSTRIPGVGVELPFRIPLLASLLPEFNIHSMSGSEKRLWEILDDYNLSTEVVGWFNTWPPSNLRNGYVLSDRADLQEYEQGSVSEDPLLESVGVTKVNLREAANIVGLDAELPFQKAPQDDGSASERSAVETLSKDLARDKFYGDIVLKVIEKDIPDFLALYFTSTDDAQHLFWKYYDPKGFPSVDAESIEKYGDVIPRVYEFVDWYLGELLRLTDGSCTIVIVSDHGAGPWLDMEGAQSVIPWKSYHSTYSGNHRENGILLLKGPGIRDEVSIRDTSIYDIAPTLAYLAGIPISEEMEGGVIEDAFTEEHLSQNPIRSIRGFGRREFYERDVPESIIDEETNKRLRALGYVQ